MGDATNSDVNLFIDGKDNTNHIGTLKQDEYGYFSHELNTTKYPNGVHTIYAVFRNTSGKEIWKSISMVINNPVATTTQKPATTTTTSTTIQKPTTTTTTSTTTQKPATTIQKPTTTTTTSTTTQKPTTTTTTSTTTTQKPTTTTTTSTTTTQKPTTTTTTSTTTTQKPTTTTTTSTTTTQKPTTTTTISMTATTTSITTTSFYVGKTSISLVNGEQYEIPINMNDITFKSTNTNVAIVSPKGIVTALGIGEAIISIIDKDYNVIQIKVSVKPDNDPSGYKLGDVNNDGQINAVDASSVLFYYAMISTNKDGGYNDNQKAAADVNHDGQINAVDASCILSYYAYVSTTREDIKPIEEFLKK